MLTAFCVVVAIGSILSLIISIMAFLKARSSLKIGIELLPLKKKLDGFDEKLVQSVMEEGGDASVEAVLRTAARLMEISDGTLTTVDAVKQARDMHKR